MSITMWTMIEIRIPFTPEMARPYREMFRMILLESKSQGLESLYQP